MKLKIRINMDNAAFEDNDKNAEIMSILDQMLYFEGLTSVSKYILRDRNGNRCGFFKIVEG